MKLKSLFLFTFIFDFHWPITLVINIKIFVKIFALLHMHKLGKLKILHIPKKRLKPCLHVA